MSLPRQTPDLGEPLPSTSALSRDTRCFKLLQVGRKIKMEFLRFRRSSPPEFPRGAAVKQNRGSWKSLLRHIVSAAGALICRVSGAVDLLPLLPSRHKAAEQALVETPSRERRTDLFLLPNPISGRVPGVPVETPNFATSNRQHAIAAGSLPNQLCRAPTSISKNRTDQGDAEITRKALTALSKNLGA